MKIYLFICTRHRRFGISTLCAICNSVMLCKAHYFGKRWFFMKYFKLVHAPTWKILHYMTSFLSICTRHEAFGFFDCFALAATLLCLVRSILWKKMIFFHEIFQAGACPNLKVSSIHDFFFYSYVQDRYSSVPSTVFAICDSLMLCKVHYFGKRWYFMKYFKLVHAPTWKIP